MSRQLLGPGQLQRAMRMELCANCPFRRGEIDPAQTVEPLQCESHCPVFECLPELKATAERLNPPGDRHEAVLAVAIDQSLRQRLQQTGDKRRVASLRYHRHRLARRLATLLEI